MWKIVYSRHSSFRMFTAIENESIYNCLKVEGKAQRFRMRAASRPNWIFRIQGNTFLSILSCQFNGESTALPFYLSLCNSTSSSLRLTSQQPPSEGRAPHGCRYRASAICSSAPAVLGPLSVDVLLEHLGRMAMPQVMQSNPMQRKPIPQPHPCPRYDVR